MAWRVWKVPAVVVFVAWFFGLWFPPDLDPDLKGQVALITGGSRGSGRGFAMGLSESGATVFITGRTLETLLEACAAVPGPGTCTPIVADSRDDESLEALFLDIGSRTNGRLDILVNNAYSAVGYLGKHKLVGKPFWQQGMELFDEVHTVGVRSHFKATLLALPLLRNSKRGLIVNTNSPGCLVYAVAVAYGMGKCSIDKMSSDMAVELATEHIDVVSWWAQAPMQTEEILKGAVDGSTSRRGALPGFHLLTPFNALYHTTLAGTLLFEGRALSAFARDRGRAAQTGFALQSAQVAGQYGIRDERGVRAPAASSIKWHLFSWIPMFRRFAALSPQSFAKAAPTASLVQRIVFGCLPDINIPLWFFKLLQGIPLTMQWPLP